jgi:hypothetical protein
MGFDRPRTEGVKMHWPFKTTVCFKNTNGPDARLDYLVSAGDSVEAKSELEHRLINHEMFGYIIEHVAAASKEEAASYTLPPGCIMLLG